MFPALYFFKSLILFFIRLLLKHIRKPKSFHRSFSSTYGSSSSSLSKFHRYSSFAHRSDLLDQTLVFSVEGALLKSPSLFPYFMLVAFEAGSLIRAFVLLISYPLVCFVGHEMGLNIMVMICFFGIKKQGFIAGRAVLPKFFFDNVSLESFEALLVRSSGNGKKVGVSDMPQVMVNSFLKDYLEIDHVVGRELKVFNGYFLGLMEGRKKIVLDDEDGKPSPNIIGVTSFNKSNDHLLFSQCKEIYLVGEGDRRNWHELPRNRYPKPLIFHDGRLAFRPTPMATLAMFMWFPFGILLLIIRALIGLTLPYNFLIPLLSFTGLRLTVINHPSSGSDNRKNTPQKGHLYVCNHRTLFDPLYFSFGMKRPVTAVTYSLSKMSELLAPIKTVRLTRDRDQDRKMMEKLLSQGDMMVCPEGTTCREPYLLRFSPLFSELSDDIVPVAMDCKVSMFYGTTAGGLKCLDPLLFMMNPFPSYTMQCLDKVSGASMFRDMSDESSRYDVANYVQKEIGNVLGFECTNLTRKDKYLILAGNEGFV